MSFSFVFIQYASDFVAEISINSAKTLCNIGVDCRFAYAEFFSALPYGGACFGYVSAFGQCSIVGVGLHIFSPSGKVYAEKRTDITVFIKFV